MLVIFYLLLMLRVGRCTNDQIAYTKTVGVGDAIKLTCNSKSLRGLFWIRIVSGKFPEVLGRSFTFHSVDPRIKTTEEAGAFSLHIQETQLSDTGVYCCMKTEENLIFLSRTDLRVAGPAPNISNVGLYDRVHSTDLVPLQYSVFTDPDNKMCPVDYSLCSFRSRSDESHPSFNNVHGSSFGKTEEDIYCGEIFCVNRSTPYSEAVNMCGPQKYNIILSLLSVALTICLFIITFLLCTIKNLKKRSFPCNAAVAVQRDDPTESNDPQSEQKEVDPLVYSALDLMEINADEAEGRNEQEAEGEMVYSDV